MANNNRPEPATMTVNRKGVSLESEIVTIVTLARSRRWYDAQEGLDADALEALAIDLSIQSKDWSMMDHVLVREWASGSKIELPYVLARALGYGSNKSLASELSRVMSMLAPNGIPDREKCQNAYAMLQDKIEALEPHAPCAIVVAYFFQRIAFDADTAPIMTDITSAIQDVLGHPARFINSECLN